MSVIWKRMVAVHFLNGFVENVRSLRGHLFILR